MIPSMVDLGLTLVVPGAASSITRAPGNVKSPTDSENGVRAGLWVEGGRLVSQAVSYGAFLGHFYSTI